MLFGGAFLNLKRERKERERETFFFPEKQKRNHQKSLSLLFFAVSSQKHTHTVAYYSLPLLLFDGVAHTHAHAHARARALIRENGRDNGPTLAPGDGQSPVLLQSHLQLQRVRLGDRDRLPGGVLPFRNVGRGEDDDERGVLEKTDRGDRDDLWGDVWGVFGHGE